MKKLIITTKRHPVFGMANELKEIRRQLDGQSEPVIEHIVKFLFYPKSQDVNHWRKEVWANLYRVRKYKKTNKPPKAQFIYDSTWGINHDTLDGFIKIVESDYGERQINAKDEYVYLYTTQYFEWLATELSQKGYVTSQEVYAKLDEMLR